MVNFHTALRYIWLCLCAALLPSIELLASEAKACAAHLQAVARVEGTPCQPLIQLSGQPICQQDIETAREQEKRVEDVTRLLRQRALFEYVRRHQLQPSSSELEWWRQALPGVGDGAELSAERKILMDRMGCSIIANWKAGRVLHTKYGGRVLLSSMGLHLPIDAWYRYLRQLHEKGDLVFVDPSLEADIWQRLQQDDWSDGAVDEAEGREILAAPPWLGGEDSEE